MMKTQINYTVYNKALSGTVDAIPSKSQAHRLLICAAFSAAPTMIICPQTNQDIDATAECLTQLGAKITRTPQGYCVQPANTLPKQAVLNCRESGSTLRFLLPIAGALGIETTFQLSGRLPQRPLSPLWEEMERMGCQLSRPTPDTIHCKGKLRSGHYTISGTVSSQFISGLLFAMALIDGHSRLHVTGTLESAPYVHMTCQAMETFGISTQGFNVKGSYPFNTPGQIHVEGDWSNAAFFLTANFLGSHIQIDNLNPKSAQGDKSVVEILEKLSENITVSAAQIPDLIPILAVAAAAKNGATFTNVNRLRLKESDRVESVSKMLQCLGCHVETTEDTMTVFPGHFHGCAIDTSGDHRIAMAAAIAATIADGPVTILQADCVAKSFPDFWTQYAGLGGIYE